MNKKFDVMIVGGGPAGVSTWLHLHKYAPDIASRTVIIEKKEHPREKLCGGALLNDIVNKVFNKLQIDLKILKVEIHNLVVKNGNNQFTFKKNSFMSIINRSIFDEYLVNIARNRGACIYENEAFVDMQHDNDNLVVNTIKNEYSTKIIVGADGALSKVRKKMSIPNRISYASTLETFMPVNQEFDKEYYNNSAVLDWSCISDGVQGYIWHFPCIKNNEPYMNHGIYDSRINRFIPQGNIKKVYTKALENRGILFSEIETKSHPVPYFNNDGVLSDKNVLLVGDAAGIEPLIGGGIHLSLLYGDVSARAIISSFKNDDFSLKDYTKNVNNHFVGKYINNSTSMAKKVYAGKMNLLDTIKMNLEQIGKH
ncbi:MAG: hypothetical protein DRN27_07160 [Thermoplasmata archaeon]|nr:MAG: hypothetical protein DRN27_07160 [Thermoplasmata archaeon]